MNTREFVRASLLWVQGFVTVTAVAGGVALVLGALDPRLATFLSPPASYLDGSPFSSYLVPGLALGAVLGGIHAVAFVMVLRRHVWAVLAATAAGYAALVWIFVQMIYIPFSFLQAVYFVAGLTEVGLVLLLLGVLRRDRMPLGEHSRALAD
jgi:hypothetical protein